MSRYIKVVGDSLSSQRDETRVADKDGGENLRRVSQVLPAVERLTGDPLLIGGVLFRLSFL